VTVDLEQLMRIGEVRRFEPRTMEIAKRLFIHNETPKRLSVEYGLNVQRIYAIRREVLAVAKQLELPDGWAEVTLAGPKELIQQLATEYVSAMKKLKLEPRGAL
jgi:hypothetical protein